MMAGLQVAFRIFSKSDPDPATLVTQLNVALKENLPQSKFVTLFLGRLDTNTGAIEYVNAGHTPPLYLHKHGAVELTDSDLLLGVDLTRGVREPRAALEPGDSLVLFTDGVTEARNLDGDDLGVRPRGRASHARRRRRAFAIAGRYRPNRAKSRKRYDDNLTMMVVVPAKERCWFQAAE